MPATPVRQALLSKLVAEIAPAELRGTAFGISSLVSGIALLPASVLAGLIWSRYGAPYTCVAGAVIALLAVMGLLMVRTKVSHTG